MAELNVAIIGFFEVIAVVIFRNIIYQKKIYENYKVMVPIGIIVTTINKVMLDNTPNIAVAMLIMFIAIGHCFSEKIRFSIGIIETITGFLFMILGETIALGINVAIWGEIKVEYSWILYFTWIFMILFMLKIPKKYYIDFNNTVNRNKTFILLIINMLPIMYISKVLFDSGVLTGYLGFQVLFLLYLIFILTISTYNSVINEVKERDRLRAENSFKPILEDYINKLRLSEHEYKNHLNAIYGMIVVGDQNQIKDRVEEYIKEIKKSDSLNELLYVDNTILKATLYSKLSEAEKNNIKVEYDIKSNLKDIKINSIDLVTLISNLLNNALEAAKESKNPWIKVEIFEENINGKIIHNIVVENSVNDISNVNLGLMMSNGYTTKGGSRGFGLSNINNIIKSKSGDLLIEPKEKSISILIKI